jgi:hypothetical protein
VPASGRVYAIFSTILKRGTTISKEREYILGIQGNKEQCVEWTRFEISAQMVPVSQCTKKVCGETLLWNYSSDQVPEDCIVLYTPSYSHGLVTGLNDIGANRSDILQEVVRQS